MIRTWENYKSLNNSDELIKIQLTIICFRKIVLLTHPLEYLDEGLIHVGCDVKLNVSYLINHTIYLWSLSGVSWAESKIISLKTGTLLKYL